MAIAENELQSSDSFWRDARDQFLHDHLVSTPESPPTSEGRRILVADDEPHMRDALCVLLESHGHIVLRAADEAEAVAKVRSAFPDLVVLAVTMRRNGGFEALRQIRSLSVVPVIAMALRGDEDDAVRALHLGADDCVGRPFGQRELLARVESVLRRAARAGAAPEEVLVVDEDLTLDFARNRVVLRGAAQTLTATEHRLLRHLVANAGRLLPFEALLARVWGPEYREEVHYVRLYVSYLRAKIEPDPAHPRYILTEKGLGYRFAGTGARGRVRG